MTVYALVLLALAAVGGLTMVAIRVRSEQNPPLALALGHGVLAATGLLLAIVGGVQAGFSAATGGGVGLLVLAALGGFVLIATHLRGQTISLGLVVGHVGLAVLGVVALVASVAGLA